MIAGISGVVHEAGSPLLLRTAAGVVWEIRLPDYAGGTRLTIGDELFVWVAQIYKDGEEVQTYGFFQHLEQCMFRAFVKVSRIGPAMALKMLGESAEMILQELAERNRGELTRLGWTAAQADRITSSRPCMAAIDDLYTKYGSFGAGPELVDPVQAPSEAEAEAPTDLRSERKTILAPEVGKLVKAATAMGISLREIHNHLPGLRGNAQEMLRELMKRVNMKGSA